jgi:hypothetical protein
MPRDAFHDRERAEEAAYFSQQDAKLIEKLRARAKLGEIAAAMAAKLQVDDPAMLDRIAKLGITLETAAAFLLAPLVGIAWVDGDVSQAERDVIVRIASDRGVPPDSRDMSQLLKWLDVRPSGAVFGAALDAIKVGLSVLPSDEANRRIDTMIKACEDVAQAAGGLSRLLALHGRVTTEERSILDEIRQRLTGR